MIHCERTIFYNLQIKKKHFLFTITITIYYLLFTIFKIIYLTELPWDEAAKDSNEYTQWCMDDYITITPWKKMDNRALSLAKKILNPEPKDRLTVDKIICQPWMQTLYDAEGDVLSLFFLCCFVSRRRMILGCCWRFGNLAM